MASGLWPLASGLAREARFVALARRVRRRRLLDWARRGALWALGGAAALAAGARLAGRPEWEVLALLWAALALGAAAVAAVRRRPGTWDVALAADGLGLEDRAASALHAAETGHPAAPLLAADAARALATADPHRYRLVPEPARWRPVALAGLALLAAAVVPLPAPGAGGRRAADAAAIAAARQAVQAIQVQLPKTSPDAVGRRAAAELEALDQQLARVDSAPDAARALEQAQERLAALAQPEDFAWRRALDGLAAAWAGRPELGALADALRRRDQAAVERAAADLAARAGAMTPEELQHLQLALQAGANAARDVPGLAAALRQAAARAGAAAAAGAAGSAGSADPDAGAPPAADLPEAFDALGSLLGQGAGRAASTQATQYALGMLGDARAALAAATNPGNLASPNGPVWLVPGQPTGTPTAAVLVPAAGGAAGTGSGAGSGSGAAGGGGGAGPAPRTGGGAGALAGGGAGLGTAPGQPDTRPRAGGSAPQPGDAAAPSSRGAATYDPVYAPQLLGGEGGPVARAPGDVAGGGDTVVLPQSPAVLGAQRPYDEVYGQYEAAARQSLARQSLPPNLQGLVQRYFSAIEPGKSSDE